MKTNIASAAARKTEPPTEFVKWPGLNHRPSGAPGRCTSVALSAGPEKQSDTNRNPAPQTTRATAYPPAGTTVFERPSRGEPGRTFCSHLNETTRSKRSDQAPPSSGPLDGVVGRRGEFPRGTGRMIRLLFRSSLSENAELSRAADQKAGVQHR